VDKYNSVHKLLTERGNTDNCCVSPLTRISKRKALREIDQRENKLIRHHNISVKYIDETFRSPPEAAKTQEGDIKIFSLSTPVETVSKFIKAVCRCVFTKVIWGSRHNMSVFLASVDKYIQLQKGESLTIAMLTDKLKIKDITWMQMPANQERNVSAKDRHFRSNTSNKEFTQHLRELVYWIFTSFINPLLGNCFYITEGEGLGSELLFFRKSVWSNLVKKGELQLQKSFMEVKTLSYCYWYQLIIYLKLPSYR